MFVFVFIFVLLTATCRVRSCYCWFVDDDSSLRLKKSFSSFSFLWTCEHIIDLVVYKPAMFPTTLMIRLFDFIYETLFSKLQQTTNNSKKVVIIWKRILARLYYIILHFTLPTDLSIIQFFSYMKTCCLINSNHNQLSSNIDLETIAYTCILRLKVS